MKKFLFIFFFLIPFFGNAEIAKFMTAAYVHGYWTNWQIRNKYYEYVGLSSDEMDFLATVNNKTEVLTGMEFREKDANEWDWCFKFEIDNYIRPDKKSRKQHQKWDLWYEYDGWVEYYVTDEYPTIEKVLEYYKFPLVKPKGDSVRAKRRARAKIKIAPYKDVPTCFNILFDGVGVGLQFYTWPFDKSCVVQ